MGSTRRARPSGGVILLAPMPGLVIRQEQLDVFRRKRQEDLSTRICAGLRANRPDLIGGLTDGELKTRVAHGIRRACSHGLKKLYSIAMFVELMFLVAPNFDEYPVVASVFASSMEPPDDRVDHVIFCMTEPRWQEARRLANPAAWES